MLRELALKQCRHISPQSRNGKYPEKEVIYQIVTIKKL
jgi:hypothetical protein